MSGSHETALAEQRISKRIREDLARAKAAQEIEAKREAERSFVQRFAHLFQERRDLTEQLAELTEECEQKGHSPKAMKVIARRMLETAEERIGREALEEEVDRLTVEHGFDKTPLGRAAAEAAHP